MPRTVHALFVSGPLDGRVEIRSDRDRDYVEAVERTGPPAPRDLEDPAWEEVTLTKVAYVETRFVDLDGTRIAIFAPTEEMVPRGPSRELRPNVTLWSLANDRADARQRIRELEDDLRASRARETWAVRHADALAGELRNLRDAATLADAPTSGDD